MTPERVSVQPTDYPQSAQVTSGKLPIVSSGRVSCVTCGALLRDAQFPNGGTAGKLPAQSWSGFNCSLFNSWLRPPLLG